MVRSSDGKPVRGQVITLTWTVLVDAAYHSFRNISGKLLNFAFCRNYCI